MKLETREINGKQQSERGCVGHAPSLGRELQPPGTFSLCVLLLLMSRVLRFILDALFGFQEEAAFRDTFGMGHELIEAIDDENWRFSTGHHL